MNNEVSGGYSAREQAFFRSRKIARRILLGAFFALPLVCLSLALILTPASSGIQGRLTWFGLALLRAVEWCFYGFAVYKILLPCSVWVRRLCVLGFPSWHRCTAAIKVHRIATITPKVAGAKFSLGFALGFMAVGGVITAIGEAWGVGALRGLGIYLFAGGIVDLIEAPMPPGVLLLAPSTAETIAYQSMLDYALGGPGVVSLLDPEQTELPTECRLSSEFVFRTAQESEWFDLVRLLSYLAELIVLDTRHALETMKREANWVLSDRYTARKLFLIVGSRDESPVVDDLVPGVRIFPDRRFTASGLLSAFEQVSKSRASLREFLSSTGQRTGLPSSWTLL